MNLVESTLNKNIFNKYDKIGVALSGGVDSVALLLILLEISQKLSLDIFAIHINHSIRKESGAEEIFVKKLCESLDVECYKFTLDKSIYNENGSALEEIARYARYEIFESIAKEKGAYIALGHHIEDQAETVFMNILRGSGLTGLSGMKYRNGIYLRPILDLRKSQLIEYLSEKGVKNITDKSNFDENFTRNKIRQNIFPYIDKNMDVDIIKKISNLSNIISDDDEFINNFSKEKFNELAKVINEKVVFEIADLLLLDRAIARRIFRQAIAHFRGSLKDISFNVVEQIFFILKSENKSLNLPENLLVKKVYERLEFSKKQVKGEIVSYNIEKTELEKYFCNDSPTEPFVRGDFEFSILQKCDLDKSFDYFSKNPFKKCLDYDKFKELISIRTRKTGDYIKIKSGNKSLKKFFIDEKIREDKRDEIYLIASGDDIAWVVARRISESFKISKETDKILIIEYKGDLDG